MKIVHFVPYISARNHTKIVWWKRISVGILLIAITIGVVVQGYQLYRWYTARSLHHQAQQDSKRYEAEIVHITTLKEQLKKISPQSPNTLILLLKSFGTLTPAVIYHSIELHPTTFQLYVEATTLDQFHQWMQALTHSFTQIKCVCKRLQTTETGIKAQVQGTVIS